LPFTLVLFPVSGYARDAAMGVLGFYDDVHDPIIFLCAPVVIVLLSYFVDLCPLINLMPCQLALEIGVATKR
jgi:hypothetical protein